MRRIILSSAVAALALGVTAGAQQTKDVHPGRGGSPHVVTEWKVDGATVSIEYGRPSLKGRAEAELMPPGKPWRSGADEATLLTTDKALTFGTVKLKPGTYTINTQPGADAWELLVGTPAPATERRPKQWGIPYQQALEVGRAPMKLGKTSAPVEVLTYFIDDTPAGATLRLEWGSASASIPFTVDK